MGGACSTKGEKRNPFRLLAVKPERKRPLGRRRRRWVHNTRIKMDLGVDWVGLAQDRDRWGALVKSVMNLRAP
jgi:hypothetical protein